MSSMRFWSEFCWNSTAFTASRYNKMLQKCNKICCMVGFLLFVFVDVVLKSLNSYVVENEILFLSRKLLQHWSFFFFSLFHLKIAIIINNMNQMQQQQEQQRKMHGRKISNKTFRLLDLIEKYYLFEKECSGIKTYNN